MKPTGKFGPDPAAAFPNPAIPGLCFIKNVITRPNILVGDYTYYHGDNGAERFEEHITRHYDFIGLSSDYRYILRQSLFRQNAFR